MDMIFLEQQIFKVRKMNIEISDQEKEELKSRVIAQTEQRLVSELSNQMIRTINRELFNGIKIQVIEKISIAILKNLTEDKIEKVINDALSEKMKTSYYGESWLEKELNKAISNIATKHAETIGKELNNIFYISLKNSFSKKEDEK